MYDMHDDRCCRAVGALRDATQAVHASGLIYTLTELQDAISRGGKSVPLYAKITAQKSRLCTALVVHASEAFLGRSTGQPGDPPSDTACTTSQRQLASGDRWWSEVQARCSDASAARLRPHIADCHEVINVLFSSGTTGTPKAIPWTHVTPLRCAAAECPCQGTWLRPCASHLLATCYRVCHDDKYACTYIS